MHTKTALSLIFFSVSSVWQVAAAESIINSIVRPVAPRPPPSSNASQLLLHTHPESMSRLQSELFHPAPSATRTASASAALNETESGATSASTADKLLGQVAAAPTTVRQSPAVILMHFFVCQPHSS